MRKDYLCGKGTRKLILFDDMLPSVTSENNPEGHLEIVLETHPDYGVFPTPLPVCLAFA